MDNKAGLKKDRFFFGQLHKLIVSFNKTLLYIAISRILSKLKVLHHYIVEIILLIKLKTYSRIYYICSKIRLTENVYPLTPALTRTLTLKHNNVFKLKSFFEKVYRYQFSRFVCNWKAFYNCNFLGEVTDDNRDEIAECMFEVRPNCQSCSLNSAARFQSRRCNFCRMQCEDDGKTWLDLINFIEKNADSVLVKAVS